jgi:hypothetical protein
MLPETAARRMRWWMVRAVIECLGSFEQRREGGGEAKRRLGLAGDMCDVRCAMCDVLEN